MYSSTLMLLLVFLLVSCFAETAVAEVFPLNVGVVTPSGDLTSANVMQKGTSTSHDSWDPAPFSDLSTWDSPEVTFGVWIADVGGTPQDATLSVKATVSAPGGDNTNYAKCNEPSVSPESDTIHMITPPGDVNKSAVRVRINPNPGGNNCAQPGQTEIYVTFTVTTSDGKSWDPIPGLYFVYTYGNPLDISSGPTTPADIASQGSPFPKWTPKNPEGETVGSHIDTMTVYLQVPEGRSQSGNNKLVLGGEQGVHLVGISIDRAKVKCTAGDITKACQAIVQDIAMPSTDVSIPVLP